MMQVQYIIWLSCCFKRMNKDREFTESKTIKQNTKMKKRILGAALLVAIAVAAGWNYNQSRNEVPLSDLALANAEALAQRRKQIGEIVLIMVVLLILVVPVMYIHPFGEI